MRQRRVLFVGPTNGSRSQMAEAIFNKIAGEDFQAFSAGFKPGEINPLAVQAVKEIGIDMAGQSTKTAFSLYTHGMKFNHIFCLGRKDKGEKCPVIPGHPKYIEWPVEDPDTSELPAEEKMASLRKVRDELRQRIQGWLGEDHSKERGFIDVQSIK